MIANPSIASTNAARNTPKARVRGGSFIQYVFIGELQIIILVRSGSCFYEFDITARKTHSHGLSEVVVRLYCHPL